MCISTLWEGLDIPGPALENVIIASFLFHRLIQFSMQRETAVGRSIQRGRSPLYAFEASRQGIGRFDQNIN